MTLSHETENRATPQPVFDPGHAPIEVEGARVHNLRNISLRLPWNRFTVITGPSGSGKSSLAFDTIYAEGQRQYIESLSVYSRQFLHQLERPDVDSIQGLQPTVAIDQRGGTLNPRSTVATVTEIYDFLRLLFARVGLAHCYRCGRPIRQQTPEQILEEILHLPDGVRLMLLAPVVRGRKGQHKDVFRRVLKQGFVRARVDGSLVEIANAPELDPQKYHNIEVIVDRIVLKDGVRPRVLESLKLALNHGEGLVDCLYEKERQVTEEGATRSIWRDIVFSTKYCCPRCKINYMELEPRTFSFNSPYGVCPECQGLGRAEALDPDMVIPDPNLNFEEGVVQPLRALPGAYRKTCRELVLSFLSDWKIAENTPFRDCPEVLRNIFLYGTENQSEENAIQLAKLALAGHDVTPLDVEPVTEKTEPNENTGPNEKSGEDEQAEENRTGYYSFAGLIPFLENIYETTKNAKVKEILSAFRSDVVCRYCGGSRIRPEARSVTVAGKRIHEITAMCVTDALDWFHHLELEPEQRAVANPILEQITERLDFMNRIGLDYITLDRSADSLSGGEHQRVRLATSLGSGLVGVCYVLDEPSTGLHPRDNNLLIEAMRRLREQGNTVLCVEHDEAIIRSADWLVDIGPGAGREGGQVLAEGTPDEVAATGQSLTGRYLGGRETIPVPRKRRRAVKSKMLVIDGVTTHNLKNVGVSFPLGTLTCVTGVSGSGKSSLVNKTLVPAVMRRLWGSTMKQGTYTSLRGVSRVEKLVQIDQTPIGRSPRSNPATYSGLFDEIRKVFASSRDAKRYGYKAGRFSFNVAGGRCEECQGQGVRKIEMHFLPDLYAVCPVCEGKRFNQRTLSIKYKDKSIADVLDMTMDEAATFFENHAGIFRILESFRRVGLGYLTLGQSSTTLSGGEAQRVKLATELSRVETGSTLYVLDEPTCGLHSNDVRKLLDILTQLVSLGNTVLVIEHNLDVMKTADWIIDMGPEGGRDGGQVMATGTPEEIAALPDNYTGQYLRTVLPPAGKTTRKKSTVSPGLEPAPQLSKLPVAKSDTKKENCQNG